MHEGEAGEHGAGGGGTPLAPFEKLMDPSIAVGRVAGLAFDAEDFVADGDLVIGGDGALIDPCGGVEDADGVEVVDGEAAIARHGIGVEGVVVKIVFDDEGLADVFADKLERVHGAESDEAYHESEGQVHAAWREEGQQHEDDGDSQEQPGKEGVVGGGGHGTSGAEEERGGDLTDVPVAEGYQGEQGRDGPQGAPADDAGFKVLVLLHARGDEGVDAGESETDGAAEEEGGEVGGIEKADPELMDVQPASRGEHEGDDAVDDDEAGKGGPEINPAIPLVELGVQLVPAGEIEEGCGNLDEEEDPLDGPAPDEDVDEVAGGGGGDESDCEPDADAADCSIDDGEQDEELGVGLEPVEQGVVMVLKCLALGEDKEEATADGEVGDEHVESGYERYEQACAKRYVPDGVVHDASSRLHARRCERGAWGRLCEQAELYESSAVWMWCVGESGRCRNKWEAAGRQRSA